MNIEYNANYRTFPAMNKKSDRSGSRERVISDKNKTFI